MNDSHEKVTSFLAEFGDANFRHGEHLISGLRSGPIKLYSASESSQTREGFLSLYKIRRDNLQTKYEGQHTELTRELCADLEVLCRGLNESSDPNCDLWTFEEEPYFHYCVFIGRPSRQVLGCFRAVDNRLITPEIRKQLWGEPTKRSMKRDKR